jgi:hypothetical protein
LSMVPSTMEFPETFGVGGYTPIRGMATKPAALAHRKIDTHRALICPLWIAVALPGSWRIRMNAVVSRTRSPTADRRAGCHVLQ